MLNEQGLLKAPKGTTISRRLMYLLMGLFIFVAIFFVTFLKIYTPKRIAISPSEAQSIVDNETSLSIIHKINQEHPDHIATTTSPKTLQSGQQSPQNSQTTIPASNTSSIGETSEELKAASNASVDVYHGGIEGSVNTEDSSSNSTLNSSEGPSPAQGNEKAAFVQSQQSQNPDVIQAHLQKPNSAFEAKAGTIIPAILMTGIQSDLPGTIIAKVRQNVYDTASGNYLLVPQGTTLIGTYDSQVAFGQSRVLIAWSRLIFPNGTSFDLLGMPGTDLAGRSGLHDQVDNHYMRIFGSSMMLSIFGAAGQLSQPQTNNGQQLSTQQILYGAIGQQMSQTAAQMMEKNLNIQPTLNIRQGAKFNVLLTRDLVLPNPYRFE